MNHLLRRGLHRHSHLRNAHGSCDDLDDDPSTLNDRNDFDDDLDNEPPTQDDEDESLCNESSYGKYNDGDDSTNSGSDDKLSPPIMGNINQSNDDNSGSGSEGEEDNSSKFVNHSNDNQRYGIDVERLLLLTVEDILFFGLAYAGFKEERQQVRDKLNVNRFKAHFGPEPITVLDLLLDLKDDSRDIVYKDVLMSLNWLKSYDTEHVLAGRWKYGEDYIRRTVKTNTEKIASLKNRVIEFAGFHDDEIHWVSVDTVNYDTEEFRMDPGTKWYNHKSHSSGLKYEYAVALRRSELVHMRGPKPAGEIHDRTVFCGGTKETPKEEWDKTALYFKLPAGKKAIGDSAYKGIPEKVTVSLDGHSKRAKDFINAAKARGESYHGRLANYQVLRCRFRHGHGKSTMEKIAMHKMCTEAVCVIVQYDLKYHPLMHLIGKIKVE